MVKKIKGTVFDLEKYEKDPLTLVVKNKEIVEHLRAHGINGFVIKDILDNWRPAMLCPIAVDGRWKKDQRQIDYALRHLKALVSSDVTTLEEKEYLRNMYTRIFGEKWPYEKDKTGKPIYKAKFSNEISKTDKQMYGRQVAALGKYIKPFNKMYLQKEIYSLIAELLMNRHEMVKEFNQNQIANFDKNNS